MNIYFLREREKKNLFLSERLQVVHGSLPESTDLSDHSHVHFANRLPQ